MPHHARIDTPAYRVWVEARPAFHGKGKAVFYDAVGTAARAVIREPITTSDIEVEIVYSTSTPLAECLDADNVNKPTLDALKGVAFRDDGQIRDIRCTRFHKADVGGISGRVEHIGRLFYTPHEHVVLISIYSDSRLAELGGEAEVQRQRAIGFERDFNAELSAVKNAAKPSDEGLIFDNKIGVYFDPQANQHICQPCLVNGKRSLLTNSEHGFKCHVCTGYFRDPARPERFEPPSDRGPTSWMAR